MRIRVANIIEEARVGGPQIRMVTVAKALAETTDTLIVMPQADSPRFRSLCDAAGVTYRAIALTRLKRDWRGALAFVVRSPAEIIGLARLLRRERADLVHISGGSWQYKGLIAARIAGIPSVWHLNDTGMPGWIRKVFRRLQPMAGGFIFASRRTRDYYRGCIAGNRPESIVPSAVDRDLFSPQAVASERDTPDPVICTIANVTPVKGLETLLRAAAELQQRHPGLRVEIAGDRPDSQKAYAAGLDRLEQELGVTIRWLGPLEDVRPLLARSDIYVCASVAESSPVAVWEAMSMALPIVSTDVGDVAHHVKDGESGFVVAVGDPDAMAERIGRLLADPVLRDRMGLAAREASACFSPDTVAALTLDIYQQVLSR